jgi:very-short-patch-repair endonuclease
VANERARGLRKNLTPQEVKLWARLRELRQLGFHFRRQSPIKPYIVDFECRKSRLIVEVDGGQHGFESTMIRDAQRDAILQLHGYRVLRFWNHEIDSDLDAVLSVILNSLREPPHPDARSRSHPPSPKGEG